MVGNQVDDVSIEQFFFQGWQMVGKQVDEVSIEQPIIFRACRWLENK